MQIVSLPVLMY